MDLEPAFNDISDKQILESIVTLNKYLKILWDQLDASSEDKN